MSSSENMDTANIHNEGRPAGATIQMKCKSCGGILDVADDKPVLFCPYCGSKELLIENDAVTIERIRNKTHKEIEIEKAKINKDVELQKLSYEERKDQREYVEQLRRKFHKGLLSKLIVVCIVIDLLGLLIACFDKLVFAGVVAVLQIGLMVLAWLIGSCVIDPKYHHWHVAVALLSMAMVILYYGAVEIGIQIKNAAWREEYEAEKADRAQQEEEDKKQPIIWPDSGLLSELPVPDGEYGEVFTNDDTTGRANIYQISKDVYIAYEEQCKGIGYTENTVSDDDEYIAWDSNNHYLTLRYDSDDPHLYIFVELKEMENYIWPSGGVAGTLPAPESTRGIIETDRDDYFSIEVGDTSKEAFNAYINACQESGYTVDYIHWDNSYTAENDLGYHLSISYDGASLMSITVRD